MPERPAAVVDPGEVIAVRHAVRMLRRADREVLYLTYWLGMSGAELARCLGISEDAAWARLSRARAEIRRRLITPPVTSRHIPEASSGSSIRGQRMS